MPDPIHHFTGPQIVRAFAQLPLARGDFLYECAWILSIMPWDDAQKETWLRSMIEMPDDAAQE
jgi:hypothetical protein